MSQVQPSEAVTTLPSYPPTIPYTLPSSTPTSSTTIPLLPTSQTQSLNNYVESPTISNTPVPMSTATPPTLSPTPASSSGSVSSQSNSPPQESLILPVAPTRPTRVRRLNPKYYNDKFVVLFAFGHGPLASSPPLPLSSFVLVACLPIKFQSLQVEPDCEQHLAPHGVHAGEVGDGARIAEEVGGGDGGDGDVRCVGGDARARFLQHWEGEAERGSVGVLRAAWGMFGCGNWGEEMVEREVLGASVCGVAPRVPSAARNATAMAAIQGCLIARTACLHANAAVLPETEVYLLATWFIQDLSLDS
nr:acyl-CoA--sterol O-acyltransferase 1-like [Ipomoea batatas]